MSERYEMHTSSAGDIYWLKCTKPLDSTKGVPSFHECVEIPDETIERWNRIEEEYYKVSREQNRYLDRQEKHRSSMFEQLVDTYQGKQ